MLDGCNGVSEGRADNHSGDPGFGQFARHEQDWHLFEMWLLTVRGNRLTGRKVATTFITAL
jgi:hypothetical protein